MSTHNTDKIKAKLKKRYAKERRFRAYGIASLAISFLFLLTLMVNIFSTGLPAFQQSYIKLDIHIDAEVLGVTKASDREALFSANYSKLVKGTLKEMFPDAKTRKEKRARNKLVSNSASYDLRDHVIENPELIGTTQSFWFLAKDDVDVYMKGKIDRNLPEDDRRIKDFQLTWIDQLQEEGRLEKRFNTTFFTSGDSREPEQAGIKGALIGSLLTMLVTMALSFPIGVLAAVYLEEFAPQNNRWVDIIEININNLAAVPSIVFGLLGLAVFIALFGVPRSAPLVGGLVLTLMTLPTIIIASRAAIKSVPPSIREAALGLGASKVQTTFGHVVPLAMPGILTGSIIGMAQALGETAPLLMIGMVAFVADVPQGILDPATVMPVQIYLWSDSPERAFTERTSAAIMVLLAFLVVMNFIAVMLRKKFERKW
ncbi:MAG: Phosphate transport system permease protein PstA (TC 3.A.1.7.1) [uncultured Thiotrichaceae bacterium]|uniref:Phosphate transport system permease protein PstA n=1 Tax=uncultured Thiotrichaceae bacterium TaxID=298394 RepID=A0A6S6T4I5_9GAMM|nr:MAG: Phosphate transport system permease protein PstA (TC 3.A.1.7.1) [uncultured Thiotrichaceae bacterium]